MRRDERFNVGVGKTRDRRYILLEAGSHTTSEARFLAAETPTAEFTMIAPRVDDQEYSVDHRDGLFYIRTNDTGKNFRVVTAAVESPGRESWTEFIAEDQEAPLEDFEVFARFAVSTRRRMGLPMLTVQRFEEDGGLGVEREIQFPEPVYAAGAHANREFETGAFRYSYQSLVSPASVYEYDVEGGNLDAAEAAGGAGWVRYVELRFRAGVGEGRG